MFLFFWCSIQSLIRNAPPIGIKYKYSSTAIELFGGIIAAVAIAIAVAGGDIDFRNVLSLSVHGHGGAGHVDDCTYCNQDNG